MTFAFRRLRAFACLAFAAVLLWLAARSAEQAHDGLRLAAAKDDPVTLAEAGLDQTLTPARFSAAIDAALDRGDVDLAESFAALGAGRGLSATVEQRARLATVRDKARAVAAEDFSDGFLYGARDSGAAFAGALVGDLTGYGDLRDLLNEAEKMRQGKQADELVVGLAAAGLALSAATWSSVGALLPARSGLTLVKSARRAGRLSAPLAKALSAAAAKALDREALAAGLAAAGRLEFSAARAAAAKALRPGALAGFRALGQDAAAIYRGAGARGVKDVLAVAEDGSELRKAARLTAARGGATRAILATLGRGALVFAGLATAAVEAIFTLLGALLGLAMLAQRFGFWLGRRIKMTPLPLAVGRE